MRAPAVVGGVLALAGVAVVSGASLGDGVPVASIAALVGAAVCMAEATVVARRFPAIHPLAANAVGMTVGAAVLIAGAAVAGEALSLPHRRETWLALAYLVPAGSVAVFSLFLFVVHRWGASRAAFADVLVPVTTAVLAAAILHEPLGRELVVGGAVILAGVYAGALRPAPVLSTRTHAGAWVRVLRTRPRCTPPRSPGRGRPSRAGGAIGYFGDAFRDHADAPDAFEASQVVVRVASGQDVDAVTADLAERFPESIAPETLPSPPGSVGNLARLRTLPKWLAAFVAALGLTSLLHALATTMRRRRKELATLRGLGFTGRQVRGSVVWQAVSLAAAGVVLGIPLGLVVGKFAWWAVADPVGVVTAVHQPWAGVLAVGAGCLAVAALLATAFGAAVTRRTPAAALRVE